MCKNNQLHPRQAQPTKPTIIRNILDKTIEIKKAELRSQETAILN